MAGRIVPTHTPVLIVGEPGTGKWLLARMTHALGPRREQPLVVLDTATLAPVELGRWLINKGGPEVVRYLVV
jgi:DNA-binding NtrC family response regulator